MARPIAVDSRRTLSPPYRDVKLHRSPPIHLKRASFDRSANEAVCAQKFKTTKTRRKQKANVKESQHTTSAWRTGFLTPKPQLKNK